MGKNVGLGGSVSGAFGDRLVVTRRGLLTVVNRLVRNSKTQWDDVLLENRFFSKLAYIVPTFFAEFAIPQVLIDYPDYVPATLKFVDVAVVWIIMAITIAFLSSVGTILESKAFLRDKPIASYIQLGKIATYFTCGIIMVSLLVEKSPIYFFSALGAMTAVLLLIFKDTILGFVASIQLSAHDMVRMGDWVSMPKYGADGDIIEINLATIKVRNFDMTITTIPTYAFISDSFTNWRGMTDSNGRRIKRSLSIKISSIKFCSEAMLEQFSKYELIEPYIREKRTEIDQYNTTSKADKTELINGRHLTNIGVFRVYVDAYLRNNPRLNQEMTCMVRQLARLNTGCPSRFMPLAPTRLG